MKCGILLVAVLGVAACKSSKKSEPAASTESGSSGGGASAGGAAPSSGADQTFTLTPTGGDKPVKVTASIPSSWKVEKNGDDVSFNVGNGEAMVGLTAIAPNGDAGERLTKAIKANFGDSANAKREDLSDGRAWVSETDDKNAHGRMFVPTDDAVVMGFAMLPPEQASKLPEMRKVFETIKVVK
jgi:hypothetical protein